MCTPAVIPIVASTAIGTAGAIAQGQASAEHARVNAELARRQAFSARQLGVDQASAIGSAGRRIQSSALAALGASGVDTASGTVASPLAQSAVNVAADQAQVRANSALRAWGFEAEATSYEQKRKLANQGTIFGVAGSILGGAGGVASALTKG